MNGRILLIGLLVLCLVGCQVAPTPSPTRRPTPAPTATRLPREGRVADLLFSRGFERWPDGDFGYAQAYRHPDADPSVRVGSHTLNFYFRSGHTADAAENALLVTDAAVAFGVSARTIAAALAARGDMGFMLRGDIEGNADGWSYEWHEIGYPADYSLTFAEED